MPLDPYNLTPTASINRVKFMSAHGLPEAWHGKTCYQVMGRERLVARIGEQFPKLANQADPVPVFCEHYLAQGNPAAAAIADDMGRALGCLLLILKQGEQANRIARAEWDDSYWAHWGSIQHVIFGGGIMASLLGRHMLARATDMLDGLMSLTIAQYPTALPLIGAARMASESIETGWAFDFGGTNIKRARAVYANNTLIRLEQMPSIFMPVFPDVNDLFNFMAQAISTTLSKSGDSDEPQSIYISVANYVHGCHLAADTPYGRLNALGEDFCQVLSGAVSQQTGYQVSVGLVHDGTAAAKAYAGAVDTAVITVGTALGMGFPPPKIGLRQIDQQFTVRTI